MACSWLDLADRHQLESAKVVQEGSDRVKSMKITAQTNLSVLVVTLVSEWATEQEKQVHTAQTPAVCN